MLQCASMRSFASLLRIVGRGIAYRRKAGAKTLRTLPVLPLFLLLFRAFIRIDLRLLVLVLVLVLILVLVLVSILALHNGYPFSSFGSAYLSPFFSLPLLGFGKIGSNPIPAARPPARDRRRFTSHLTPITDCGPWRPLALTFSFLPSLLPKTTPPSIACSSASSIAPKLPSSFLASRFLCLFRISFFFRAFSLSRLFAAPFRASSCFAPPRPLLLLLLLIFSR